MKITIWGARGSIPTPISPQEIRGKLIRAVRGAREIDLDNPSAVEQYIDSLPPLEAGTAGGNTPCVQIEAGDELIIIDAGTGLRTLGQALMSGPCGQGEGKIHLFLSHTHWDHIQGFPFFMPAHIPGNQITIYAVHPVEIALTDQMKPATFPVSLAEMRAKSTIEFVYLTEGESLTLGDVQVTNMKLTHPGDSYAFRFEQQGMTFVYASDIECKYVDDEHTGPLIRFFAGADALIFDTQLSVLDSYVSKIDWGHSSALVGVHLATRAAVKRLILFHHDPSATDQQLMKDLADAQRFQAQQQNISTEILVGREGLVIDLTPPRSFQLAATEPEHGAVLRISEQFDQQDVPAVLAALEVDQPEARLPRLVVDLQEIRQLNLTTLRALIELRNIWKNRLLALAALSPQTLEVIELAHCLDLFAIHATVETALSALEAREILHLPGQLVKNRYRIRRKLRESNIGVVFQAEDTRLERSVALITLSPTLHQTATQRLLYMAQKMASLQHPHIATLFDSEEDRGLAYLVMEYLNAENLGVLLEQNRPPELRQVADKVLQALAYAHSKDIVHGNLRPENILVGESIKVSDFGMRLLEPGRNLIDSPVLVNDPYYLAPEQIRGEVIDGRTDLYALGLVLYRLSTGHHPFDGRKEEILDQHLNTQPQPPREINPALSRSLEHFILRLLAKDPTERYASAAEAHQVVLSLGRERAMSRPERQIQQQGTMPAATAPTTAIPAALPQQQNRLIGREAELKTLHQLWQLVEAGQGQMLLIGGEAGIGKTRLCEEIRGQVSPDIALLGRCSEYEGNPPYQPFVELMRDYLAHTPVAQARRHLSSSPEALNIAASLAPLIPVIYEILPDLETLPPLDPTQQPLRLRSNFVEFIRQVGAEHPYIIILDDLHWADPSSLQMLHYITRHLDDLPLLVIGAYRDLELAGDHPLLELMSALSRSPAFHRMHLERLDQDSVGQLLAEMWQQPVPAEWTAAIYQRTGGNPFYIKEVAKMLADEDVITFQDGHWHFSKLVDLKLPQKVRDIVLRRVMRVSEATQQILHQAAILGQQFSFADLLAVSGQPESRLLTYLDEAMTRNLIREVDADNLAFSNIEIQQVLYEELSQVRRRSYHRRVGKTLEQIHRDDLAPIAGKLAYHFLQADDLTKGFRYALQAGQYAQAFYAYRSALRWYRQAEDLLPQDIDHSAAHVALYEGLGTMWQVQARFTRATAAYQAMYQAAQTISDTVAQVRALYLLSQMQNRQGDHQAALETARQAEQAARPAKTQSLLALSLFQQGWALLKLGDIKAALEVGQRVLTFSTTLEAKEEMGHSLNLLGTIFTATGNYDQALDYQQRALSLYQDLGDRSQVARILNNMGEIYRLKEDFQAAVSLYQEALRITREIGDRAGEIVALSNLGGARVGLGDYTTAANNLRQVIELPESVLTANLTETYRFLAEADLGLGNLTESMAEAQLALALAREHDSPEMLGLAWRTLGRVGIRQAEPISMDNRFYSPADCFNESTNIFNETNMAREQARTLEEWSNYECAHGEIERSQKLKDQAQTLLASLIITP